MTTTTITMANTSAHRHRSTWWLAVPLLIVAGVICWLLLAPPALDSDFRELQACPPSEVTQVRIYDFDGAYSESRPPLIMPGSAVPAFMGQIRKAERTNPNHPRGGSTLFVEVDTVRSGTRHLRISAMENCGVLIYIDSAKVGRESRWSAGPWRNDDLIGVFGDSSAKVRRAGNGG